VLFAVPLAPRMVTLRGLAAASGAGASVEGEPDRAPEPGELAAARPEGSYVG